MAVHLCSHSFESCTFIRSRSVPSFRSSGCTVITSSSTTVGISWGATCSPSSFSFRYFRSSCFFLINYIFFFLMRSFFHRFDQFMEIMPQTMSRETVVGEDVDSKSVPGLAFARHSSFAIAIVRGVSFTGNFTSNIHPVSWLQSSIRPLVVPRGFELFSENSCQF